MKRHIAYGFGLLASIVLQNAAALQGTLNFGGRKRCQVQISSWLLYLFSSNVRFGRLTIRVITCNTTVLLTREKIRESSTYLFFSGERSQVDATLRIKADRLVSDEDLIAALSQILVRSGLGLIVFSYNFRVGKVCGQPVQINNTTVT